ncbi:MAG: hypothetical protein ACHQFW_07860 [Chitinophagales bacterium]
MKYLFIAALLLFARLCFSQVVVPGALTACDAGESPSWVESGHNKINKLQNVVLPAAGVTDTSNITVRFCTTKAYNYDAAHPELFPGAEVISFGGIQYAFYRWYPIFRINNLLSKCTDINAVLLNYGYGDGVYFIEFYQNNVHLDTSDFLYSTPIGNKATMTFIVYH